MRTHITPGYNGWTNNAKGIMAAMDRRERDKCRAEHEAENAAARERAESEYYEENNCWPRPTGYFGTETDAHFYER